MFKLLVSSFAVANAAQLTNTAPHSVLKLRGGIDIPGVNGGDMAKYYVMASGIEAGLSSISGAKSAADILEGWTDGGIAAVVGYYLFVDAVNGGTDASKAVVMASLPALAGGFKAWLNGGKSLDLSKANVGFAINAFLVYCLHTGTVLDSDLVLKIVACLNVINGLGGMFAPDLVASLPWDGASSNTLAAGTGLALLGMTMGGASAAQALAYSVLPTLYKSLDGLFLSGDKAGDNTALLLLLFQALTVLSNIQ